jgi:hypothetical protein
MLTWNQRVGLALERLTYKTLKSLMQSRIGTAGEERKGLNGPVWAGKNYTLYWNKQVVKRGQYPKSGLFKHGGRRRLADLVLTNNDLPEIVPYNSQWQSESALLQGTYTKAVLAIECKNNNLDFRWGYPSHVVAFDDDIMSRFIWASKRGPNNIANLLGFDADWEKYAGFQNIFPRAVKVLLMPNFVFTDKAKQEKPIKMNVMQQEDVDWRRQTGRLPLSFSPYGCISWRIERLKLDVLELGYHPTPNKKVPYKVKQRLTSMLEAYLEMLVPNQGRDVALSAKTAKRSVRKKKFSWTISQKQLRYLSKLGYVPPAQRKN